MSGTWCGSCGRLVTEYDEACPACGGTTVRRVVAPRLPPPIGAPRQSPASRSIAIAVGAVALVILLVAGVLFTITRTPPPPPPQPPVAAMMTPAPPRTVTFPSTAAPTTSTSYPDGWPSRPPSGTPELSPTSRWSVELPPGPEPNGVPHRGPWDGPYVAGNTVMVRTWNAKLVAFDTRTGADTWELDLRVEGVEDHVSSPIRAVAAGTETFTIAENGLLRAIDVRDGHVRWSSLTELQGGLAANGSQVVFAVNGRIRSVDAMSGARRWDVDARAAEASASLVFSSGLVVISSSGTVRALDATNGEERWIAHPDMDGAATVSASANAIWLADGRGDIVQLDPTDGSQRIEQRIDDPLDRRVTLLYAQDDGTVIVRTPPTLMAVSRSGDVLWRMQVGSTDVRQLLIGDAFITLTPFGILVSDLVTGAPRVAWRFGPPQVYSTPVDSGDGVILIVPRGITTGAKVSRATLVALPYP